MSNSPAFTAIFETIQQLKAKHAAQERANAEALKQAKAEIEEMLAAAENGSYFDEKRFSSENDTDIE
jgi:hypothetical protein